MIGQSALTYFGDIERKFFRDHPPMSLVQRLSHTYKYWSFHREGVFHLRFGEA
jgi:hypothetical protein